MTALDTFLVPPPAQAVPAPLSAERLTPERLDPEGRGAASTPRRPTAAFAGQYATVAPALHAWAVMRLGGDRSRIAPEDLTQEVWLRAFQIFDRFDSDRMEFRQWLFAVAKNVLLEIRRQLRQTRQEQAAEGSSDRIQALDQVAADATSISRRAAKNEDLRRFVDRLHELEPIALQTVLHCGIEGMPQAEAAARLGESPATTAKRWQRLRERMRSWGAPLGMLVAG